MATSEDPEDVVSEAEPALTAEQEAELDRRWSEHLKNPGAAIPWDEVRRKLQARQ